MEGRVDSYPYLTPSLSPLLKDSGRVTRHYLSSKPLRNPYVSPRWHKGDFNFSLWPVEMKNLISPWNDEERKTGANWRTGLPCASILPSIETRISILSHQPSLNSLTSVSSLPSDILLVYHLMARRPFNDQLCGLILTPLTQIPAFVSTGAPDLFPKRSPC